MDPKNYRTLGWTNARIIEVTLTASNLAFGSIESWAAENPDFGMWVDVPKDDLEYDEDYCTSRFVDAVQLQTSKDGKSWEELKRFPNVADAIRSLSTTDDRARVIDREGFVWGESVVYI